MRCVRICVMQLSRWHSSIDHIILTSHLLVINCSRGRTWKKSGQTVNQFPEGNLVFLYNSKTLLRKCRCVFERNRNICTVNSPSHWDKLSEDHPGSSVCLSVGLCVSSRQDPCWEQDVVNEAPQIMFCSGCHWLCPFENTCKTHKHTNVRTQRQVGGLKN